MFEIFAWLLFIVFIAGLVLVGALLLRGHLASGKSPAAFGGALFAQKVDRRLDVVEQANLDGRRRLVLIRRDNVEHLIMTGGPVDVVLETGIDPRKDLRDAAVHGRSQDRGYARSEGRSFGSNTGSSTPASSTATRSSTETVDTGSSLRPARHFSRVAND
ncbi:MAG: hypothetical protein AAFQ44_03460 [Pseudomonadota bacterium]